MAGDTIGRLSVLISADPEGVNKGVDAALNKLDQLKAAASSLVSDIGGGMLGGVTGGLSTILGGAIGRGVNQIAEGFKGVSPMVTQALGAMSAMPGPVGAVGKVASVVLDAFVALKDTAIAWGQAVVDAAERGMARIREQGRLAKLLGVTLSEAAGFQLFGAQSGMDQGAFLHGMAHLRREMAQARQGSLEASLAFQQMGVSAEQLASGDTGAVFRQIADYVSRSNDPFRTAILVRQAFGRADREMMSALAQGGAAFEDATDRAVRFGLAVTKAEADSVKAANVARLRMAADAQALVQGLENRLGVALAPVWENVAKGLDRIVLLAQPAFEGIRDGIDTLGAVLGVVVDGFNKGLEKFAPILDQAVTAFRDIGDIVSEIVGGSSEAERSWSMIGEFIAYGMAEGLRQCARLVLTIARNWLGFYQDVRDTVKSVDTLINGIRKAIDDLANGFRDAFNAVRDAIVAADPTGRLGGVLGRVTTNSTLSATRSNVAGDLPDLTSTLGRIDEALERLNGPQRSIAEIVAGRLAGDTARRVAAQVERAYERAGVAAAGPTVTAGMIQAARNNVLQGPQLPAALAAGSVAALSLINRMQAGQESRDDIARRMADDVERQLEEQRETNRINQEVLRILQEQGVVVAPSNIP